MKNTFAAIIVGLAIIPAFISHAQKAMPDQKTMLAITEVSSSNTNKPQFEDVRMNEISMKALRHFTNNFPTAGSVKWYATTDGFMAYFVSDGLKRRSGYDNKGNWLYNFRSYPEKYLPASVRRLVKGEYYDYNIVMADEIEKSNTTIYIVHLSNETHAVKVKVCDGEMEEMESFEK
jgi:hypothetical protein